jgi:hypothetical protein
MLLTDKIFTPSCVGPGTRNGVCEGEFEHQATDVQGVKQDFFFLVV